jgi:transposase
VPDEPLRGEHPGEHSSILLGLGGPRGDRVDHGAVDGKADGAIPAPRHPFARPGFRDPIVNDRAWERISPLIPERPRRRRNPGRRPLDDRAVLNGILVVLGRRIGFEKLPQELEYGSGMTCWRRLRDWHQAGVWQRLHEVLLARLNAAGVIDWSRAAADGSHVRALKDDMHPAGPGAG